MGILILFLTTLIWGTAFLAQKLGGEHLGPFAMTAFRNVLGGLFLLVLIAVRRGRFDWNSVRAGIACGVPLFAAMVTQQIGIQYTMPGISAFLTTNYVFFVPLIAYVLKRQLPSRSVIAGIGLALVGTYFICLPSGGLTIGRGELWTILCAFLFAVQMMVVDHFACGCNLLVMSAVQLFTCSVLGLPFLALASERTYLATATLGAVWLPLVYCGVFSSGIAYTLQNLGQARTPPALAAIVLSLESVFGTLAGWLVLGDVLKPAQLVGCALVFGAVIIAQVGPMLGSRFESRPAAR